MEQQICANCGYAGDSVSVAKGSFGVELVLWLCFFIPGLIYSLWRLGSKYPACPKCGAPQIRVAVEEGNEPVTPPMPPGTPDEVQPPATPVYPQGEGWNHPVVAPDPRRVQWRSAFPLAVAVGLLGGALTMVKDLFATPAAAQDSDIFAFASDVDADQRMEINRMSRMLEELGK